MMDNSSPKLVDPQHLLDHIGSIASPDIHLLRTQVETIYGGFIAIATHTYAFGTRSSDGRVVAYGSIVSEHIIAEPYHATERISLHLTRDLPLQSGHALPRCRVRVEIDGFDGVVHPPLRSQRMRLFARSNLTDLLPTEKFLGKTVRPAVSCGYVASQEDEVVTSSLL